VIRQAKIADVEQIQRLINQFADEGRLLARSLSEIYDNLRDFYVYEAGDRQVKGVCALHISWEDLAEVRSLAVTSEERKQGLGGQLIAACLDEARQIGVKRVFLLTNIPAYFERAGFRAVDRAVLPHKIWADCIRCVKFPQCDETAMVLDL
jgi:amino-acid N-acetyltransferase